MSQNDFNLANQGFPSMRADINSALQALASNSSGSTNPSTTYAYQWWYDTSANILKIRNAANGAWINFASFDQGAGTWSISGDLTIADKIVHSGDTNTAIRFPAADTVTVETAGTERMRITSAGNVGIGTTTPASPLHTYFTNTSTYGAGTAALDNSSLITVQNDSKTSDSYSAIRLVSENATNAGWWSIASVSTATNFNNHLVFNARTGSATYAERMRIDSAGVVTIANLAGTGSRAVNASATGVLSAASDSRLKEEVPEAPLPSLAEVMLLKPRAYKWLDDIEKRGEDAAVEIGFFADEVKDIIPSAAPMGNDGYYGFYDRSVIAALTNAIQEQQAMIASLEARLTTLEN